MNGWLLAALVAGVVVVVVMRIVGEAAVLIRRGLAMNAPFAEDRERPWDRLLR